MAVYDRWHKDSGEPCREHRKPPSAAHGQGLRWQVRWYDDDGKQCKRSFRLKDGRNPDVHADAFDAQTRRDLDTGDYTDPATGDTLFRDYAEEVRKTRTHDDVSAVQLERFLRLHAYPVIGHRSLRDLARRPSLTQAWIKGLAVTLGPNSARQVTDAVSGIYAAAQADGLIRANPVRSSGVTRPRPSPRKARAWDRGMVEAMAAALEERFRVIPFLGAGTGMRQGELFGLAVEDLTFLGRDPRVRVVRQVKHVRGVMFFAPPKRRKTRETPLAPEVAALLARHLELFPAAEVTLGWHDPADRGRHGRPVTVRLVLTGGKGRPVDRDVFNPRSWHAAQRAAGVARTRENGMHALRHTYASLQLGAGMAVTDVAAWMGDTPAVLLGTYAHFMPGREEGGRAAVSAFFAVPDAGLRSVGQRGE